MKRIFILLLSTSLLLGGCYKSEFNQCECEHNNLNILVVDPSDATIGEEAFDTYTILVGGQEINVVNGVLEQEVMLDDGTYTVHIFNTPDDYSFDVDAASESVIVSLGVSSDGYISSNPSALYYGSDDVTITDGAITSSSITPSVVTRELNLDLDLDGDNLERIESITISLSGIASGWDLVSDSPYGDAASITIPISDFSSGSIAETLNLLGIVTGEDQILTIAINYNDGNPSTTITTDLSSELSDFNSDKSTPLTISATVTLSTEAGMEGTIGDWTTTEDDFSVN